LEHDIDEEVASDQTSVAGLRTATEFSSIEATFMIQRFSHTTIAQINGGVTMPDIRREEEVKNPGLTTADVANLDETASKQEIDRDKERNREDLSRRDSTFADAPRIDRRSAGEEIATEDSIENEAAPLFSLEEAKGLHGRWDAIQVSFVDEPRQAVQEADGLVAAR
jgi:hypothetical protein